MMMKPFKLQPQYREYIWGGKRLRPQAERTAEAWVVYAEDMIADGPIRGKSLAEAALIAKETLLGSPVVEKTGLKFPLLIKIMDCADWLSLQVHPNNSQALELEGEGHFGKMEGWYIVDAGPGAQLINGFSSGTSLAQIEATVGTRAMLDIVQYVDMRTGDSMLIRPGTLHALGPGLMVYEVQQTSDITYRVYDWDRPKKAGRDLHLAQAKRVLDPSAGGSSSIKHASGKDALLLFSCEFFALRKLNGTPSPMALDTAGVSFHCLTMVQGGGEVRGNGWERTLAQYETLVIPADCGEFRLAQGDFICLDAFVPDSGSES